MAPRRRRASGAGRSVESFVEKVKRTRLGRRVRFMRKPALRMPVPPTSLTALALIVVVVYLMGGGVFTQLMHSPLIWPMSQVQISLTYPGLGHQTVAESYLVAFLYLTGIAGLLLPFLSTRYVYKPKEAYIMMFLGLVMLSISFYLLWDILDAKSANPPRTWPR